MNAQSPVHRVFVIHIVFIAYRIASAQRVESAKLCILIMHNATLSPQLVQLENTKRCDRAQAYRKLMHNYTCLYTIYYTIYYSCIHCFKKLLSLRSCSSLSISHFSFQKQNTRRNTIIMSMIRVCVCVCVHSALSLLRHTRTHPGGHTHVCV